MDDAERTTYWAGPAMVTSPDRDATIAILVLWRSAPADPDGRSEASAELLDRGFARLPAPGLEQLRALPHLADARIRLSTDGRLLVDDGAETLFEGAGHRASYEWHATARAGGLTLLVDVDVDPTPDEGAPDGTGSDDAGPADPSARALARLTAACRAGTVFGACVGVSEDDHPPADR